LDHIALAKPVLSVSSVMVKQVIFAPHQALLFNSKSSPLVWETLLSKFGTQLVKSRCDIKNNHYARTASALVVVFDVTSTPSFEDAKTFFHSYHTKSSDFVQRGYFVANKIDLEGKVDLDLARNFAQSNFATFFETSALTGEGINGLFTQIAEDLMKGNEPEISQNESLSPVVTESSCC
jgi:predicted GTPase